jgi:hypothetical protein
LRSLEAKNPEGSKPRPFLYVKHSKFFKNVFKINFFCKLRSLHFVSSALLLGRGPTGTGTIALDPTFGSFTLLEPVSH